MNDMSFNSEKTDRGMQELQRQELTKRRPVGSEMKAQAVKYNTAGSVQCPYCGTVNDPDAMFCASCGKPLGMVNCPNCGAELDPDADFCEVCHHYIRTDICSFCGSRLSGYEAFCPECGSPRGGIVCPVCHTLNDFSFCKQCGTALTDEARKLLAELQMTPEYKEMQALAKELQELDMQLPYANEKDQIREQLNNKLRERVLTLLAQDKGFTATVVEKPSKRIPKVELDRKKNDRVNRLAELLEKMAQVPQPQAAKVRNYAMACKPQGVRLAWECNFKHALHSSPCGCAKPQMGGKWIVLGKNSRQEIKDDK